MKKITLMAHLVANYPDPSGCLAAAEALVEAGTRYLEVQIPFSDPSADGQSIMNACAATLAAGYSVADAVHLVNELTKLYPDVPVFVMAYANLVVSPGVGEFVDILHRAGARGLIVPDLPFDNDEGLAASCMGYRDSPIAAVPVAAPSMGLERLERLARLGRPYLYAALRTGITGQATEIADGTRDFLELCRSGGSRVFGGFGIRSHAQARQVADHVYAVVAGSVFVDAITQAAEAHGAVQKAVQSGAFQGTSRVRDEAIRNLVRDRALELIRG